MFACAPLEILNFPSPCFNSVDLTLIPWIDNTALLQVKLESARVNFRVKQDQHSSPKAIGPSSNLHYYSPRSSPGRGELVVYEKVHFQCTISESWIAWALLSEGQEIVIAAFEANGANMEDRVPLPWDLRGEPEEDDVKKLACYVLTLPAYFLWGILKRTDPIVALLIYPDFLLRMTFRKPADIEADPFGIQLTIEGTDDSRTMVSVLKQFLGKCVELYHDPELRAMEVDLAAGKRILVHPSSWSSINVNLEDGLEQYRKSFNLGFLFRTNEDNLRRFLNSTTCRNHNILDKFRIPKGKMMIVKCLVAILDFDHDRAYSKVDMILFRSQMHPGIKTPYLFCCQVSDHQLIIMEDMGLSLSQWQRFKTTELKGIWSVQSNRKAFYEDVVLTLLTLIDRFSVSHNDIKMANIALGQNNRFCVLDFDMSDQGIRQHGFFGSTMSKLLSSMKSGKVYAYERLTAFAFTILQLSSVIFELDCLVSNVDTGVLEEEVRKKMHKREFGLFPLCETKEFRSWLLSKQDGLQDMLDSAGQWNCSFASGDEMLGYFQHIMISRLGL